MCRAVKCKTCGGTTWSGCGMHVDQVMAGVPAGQRCTCAAGKAESTGGRRRWGLFRR